MNSSVSARPSPRETPVIRMVLDLADMIHVLAQSRQEAKPQLGERPEMLAILVSNQLCYVFQLATKPFSVQ